MSNDEGWAAIPRAMLRDPSVPQEAKLVYLAVSSHVGRDGTAWPSHRTLAGYLRMSRNTISRQLEWLRDQGYLDWIEQSVEGERGIGRKSHRYRLIVGPMGIPMGGSEENHPGTQESQGGSPENQGGSAGEPERASLTKTKNEQDGAQAAPAPTPPSSEPSRKRGTRLPQDWRRTELDVAWQAREGIPDEFARPVTEEFRNYWAAATGRGAAKLDWSAAWKQWMSKEWGGTRGASYRREHNGGRTPVAGTASERLAESRQRRRLM